MAREKKKKPENTQRMENKASERELGRGRERMDASFIADIIDFVKMCDNNSSSDIKKQWQITNKRCIWLT